MSSYIGQDRILGDVFSIPTSCSNICSSCWWTSTQGTLPCSCSCRFVVAVAFKFILLLEPGQKRCLSIYTTPRAWAPSAPPNVSMPNPPKTPQSRKSGFLAIGSSHPMLFRSSHPMLCVYGVLLMFGM